MQHLAAPAVSGALQPAARPAAPAAHSPLQLAGRQRRRSTRPAALPADALDALPTAAAAAATASLLTAAWLRRTGNPTQPEPEQPEEQQEQQERPAEEPPSSAEAIWAAAWRGFAPTAAAVASAGSPSAADAETERQPAGQQQDAVQIQDSLQRSPVLLLEGIRSGDRARLLALCLAALEAQVATLPPGAGLVRQGAAEWRQLSGAMLALASLAAAAAWLGYVPAGLLAAASARLAQAQPAVLQAAGLAATAAAIQEQAAAAAAAEGGEEEGDSDGSAAVEWYCLGEKLQLYSSVLRLLTCSSIEQQQERDAEVLGLPAPGLANSSSSSSSSMEESIDAAEQQPAAGELAGSNNSGQGAVARQQALALLQQQHNGVPGSVRGWRATAAGARSESQLLALAPSALQDMAVTAADAVAAAYLADAAATGPSPSVLAPRAGGSAGGAAAATGAAAAPQQRTNSSSSSRGGEWVSVLASSRRRWPLSAARPATSSTAGASLEAGWWPTFVHRQLASTRQLQRFANAVALQRWVYRQYHGVADIYEDRLRLWAVADGGRRVEACSAPMKRTAELGQLKGLRYAASLLLEGADLLAPVLRTLWRQATAAVSWLLVRLVGQAVALFRRGVAQGSQAAAAAGGGQQRRQRKQQQQPQQQQGGPESGQQQQQLELDRQGQRAQRRRRGGDSSEESGPGWAWAA